jgi:hypothetical protein
MRAGKKGPSVGETEDLARRVGTALAPGGGDQASVRMETDALHRATRDSEDPAVRLADRKVNDPTAGISLVIAAGPAGETPGRDRNRRLHYRRLKSRSSLTTRALNL